MNVVHISSESSWRGGEQQLAYLLEEHLQLGIRCTVVCRTNSSFAAYCQQQNIPFLSLPLRNSMDVYSAFKLWQFCRSHKADLLHVHSSRGHAIAYLSLLLGNKKPMILTRRVAFFIRNKGLNIIRYNSAAFKKIICVSKAVAASTAPVVRDKKKLEVVYSGIDLSRFSATEPASSSSLRTLLQLPAATPLVGTVAALTEEKDITTFLNAAAEIAKAQPEVHFVLVGDGPELSMLEQLATELAIRERVHFLGRRNDIPQLLPQFSLFLFTSRMEGLGTSVLDAFACRIPVVATAAGGIPEMVLHQHTGLLAPVGDAGALAQAAVKVLSDRSLQQQMVQNAHELLVEKFTRQSMAAGTLRIYQEVLAKT